MKPKLTERSERKFVAEFDPTPSYYIESLLCIWVWGSIRTYQLRRYRSVTDVLIEKSLAFIVGVWYIK